MTNGFRQPENVSMSQALRPNLALKHLTESKRIDELDDILTQTSISVNPLLSVNFLEFCLMHEN